MTPGPTVPALILGGSLTGLGVLRLLAARGVPTFVAGVNRRDMVVHSRWYRPGPVALDESPDSDHLASDLSTLQLERAVLLPCTDNWTRAVAGLPAEVRARYPASVPTRPVVDGFVDKDRFQALVTDLDVPRPRCLTLHDVDDLAAATDAVIEGSFLKPIDSQRFSARFHEKGFWVRDRREAARRISEAQAVGVGLMLQEWIPGDASHNIHIDCFVDRGGHVVGTVARRKIRRQPLLLGNTSSAVTIPLSDVPEALAVTRRIIEAVRHRGVFSAEFKYDARDGRFKILEVNSRLFWYVGHTAAAGLDLAWMSYLDALGFPVPRMSRYRTGVYGLFEINDAVALRQAWLAGERDDVGAILRPWVLGHRALFWWSDPVPAVMEVQTDVRRRLAGRFGRSGAPRSGLGRERQDLPRADEHEAQPGRDNDPAEGG